MDLTNRSTRNLDVEKSHNFGLVFNSFTQKLIVNATMQYRFSNNSINQYEFYEDGIQHTTYSNIVKEHYLLCNLYVNWNASKNTRLTLNGSTSYMDARSEELGVRNHGWSANATMGLQ